MVSKRQRVKKGWLGVKMLLSYGNCSANEIHQLREAERDIFEAILVPCFEAADREEVPARRKEYEKNVELCDMMEQFWFVVSQKRNLDTNEITPESFHELNIRLLRALIGDELDRETALKVSEADYLSDTAAYGPLNKEHFFDSLLGIIDVWAENSGHFFRVAFAWALFDSIFMHKKYPVRYRDFNRVLLLPDIAENELLKRYSHGKNCRLRVAYWTKFLKNKHFSAQTYDRLMLRKNSVQIPKTMVDMLQIMGAEVVARAKLLLKGNDPNIHDIYDPLENDAPSLRKTVRTIMHLIPLKNSLEQMKLRDNNDMIKKDREADKLDSAVKEDWLHQAVAGGNDNSQTKFPVQRVVKNIMKTASGKDVLGVTIASKVLYERESTRRKSILNQKSISVSNYLHNRIYPLLNQARATENDKSKDNNSIHSQSSREKSEVRSLDTSSTSVSKMKKSKREKSSKSESDQAGSESGSEPHLSLPSSPSKDVVVDIYPTLSTNNSTANTEWDINLDEDNASLSTIASSTSRSSSSLRRGPKARGQARRLWPETNKRPVVRPTIHEWKYLLDENYPPTSGSYLSGDISSPIALPAKLKPAKVPSPVRSSRNEDGEDPHLPSPTREPSMASTASTASNGESSPQERLNQTAAMCDSNSVNSSSTAATSFSFIQRLQSTDIECRPLTAPEIEKQKRVADFEKTFQLYPLPAYDRPRTYLYHRDGSARRIASSIFDEKKAEACMHRSYSFPRKEESVPDSLPSVSPIKKGNRACRLRLHQLKRSSSLQDDCLDTTDVSSCDSHVLSLDEHEHDKKVEHDSREDGDESPDKSVFLQKDAVEDTYSWIRDMPRYLRATGNIKPQTVRAMSKSCRLGNFVVDEQLDIKEF